MRCFSPFLSLHTNPSSLYSWHPPPPPYSFIKNHQSSPSPSSSSSSIFRNDGTKFYLHRRAVGRDSEFEIDPEKAREALRKLDQQLQSISEKPMNTPKIRATDVDLTRELSEFDRATEQASAGLPEGSSLAFLTLGLLIFTIFYNVIFITVIKPSIDGPETSLVKLSVSQNPEAALSRQPPPRPEVSVQP